MLTAHALRFYSFVIISGILLSACTVQYVADYDASIVEETVTIAKKVDLFWGELLDTPTTKRQYSAFREQYNIIETDIRGLLMKNRIRALNNESTEQVEILLRLWVDDRESHKKKNSFSDFLAKRHRQQFERVFIAIAKGEKAKDI